MGVTHDHASDLHAAHGGVVSHGPSDSRVHSISGEHSSVVAHLKAKGFVTHGGEGKKHTIMSHPGGAHATVSTDKRKLTSVWLHHGTKTSMNDNGGTEVFASDPEPHLMSHMKVGTKVRLTKDAHEEHTAGKTREAGHTARVGEVVHTRQERPQGLDAANHKTFHVAHVKWPNGKVTQHMSHEIEAHS